MSKPFRLGKFGTWLHGFAPTACVFLVVCLIGVFANYQQSTIQQQRERERVRTQINALSTQLETSVNLPIEAARALVAILSTEPNMGQDRFSWLAGRTFGTSSSVRNVAAARDLVINLVYPKEGNESAIGLDYNKNDAQRVAAYLVRDSGQFVLAGPVDLVQGGTGFIARFPVFTDTDGQRTFWGLLSVVIDLPALYEAAGMNDPDLGLDLAILGRDGKGIHGDQFYGPADLPQDHPVSADVLFQNGNWVLMGRPEAGWGSTVSSAGFRLLTVAIGSTAVILAALANLMSVQKQSTIDILRRREQELETARSEVEELALHDHLTGLPNRRYLDRELAKLVEKPFAGIIQLDLDGFKAINDDGGHTLGDQLLVEVSQRLKDTLDPGTFLARSGGDEFVIICRPTTKGNLEPLDKRGELEAMARDLINCVQRPYFVGERKCRIGLSAGIHEVHPESNRSPEEWLRQADRALYSAKNEGRNRYAFSSAISEMSSRVEHTPNDLLEALSRGEIVPHYQPQIGADGVSLVGVEALARWNHPELGLLMPGEFMSLASSMKLDAVIDQQMFEHAIKDLMRWDSAGIYVPQISINVSYRRLRDPQLLDQVGNTGVNPKRVAFELLESIFLDGGDDQIEKNVKGLKSHGFVVEVDDFGTGHSSATSLLKLRPHCLKIDRSLIQAAPSSRENRRLLATIAEMGHALNISVCAEGVENMEQFKTSKSVGCTKFQGYLFARPMSADDLESYCRSGDVEIGDFSDQARRAV
ncbi:putative bifunctional diguanylate cyclase/phosphodiesterase [Celeribacter arenosi]|uniref:Periplasmic sensor diguanylate cyclase/phosphodiesterase n=1 Tax=Celeribacter arenosi TaxID=792649 RepID=A0ABP7K4T5_9RHOB